MGLYRRYIKKSFKLGMMGLEKELIENIWVRIKEQTSVGVCYRPPDQEEQLVEAFCRLLPSCSQALAKAPVGDQPGYLLEGQHSRP